MNNTSNKVISIITKLLGYIIAMIMIINCNTIYITSYNFEILNKILFPILVISGVIYAICNIFKYKLKIDNTFLIGIGVAGYLCIYILLSALFSSNLIGIRLILYFVIFFVLAWTEKDEKQLPAILKAYINIMFLLAVISIFFWIFGSYFHFISPTGSTAITWGIPNRIVPSYYNVYFETQYSNIIAKNSSIFVEAPMAALNFLISLSLNVLFLKKKKFQLIKTIIFFIAGLLTMSTAMYIGILILVIFKLFRKRSSSDKVQIIKYLLAVIIVPMIFLLILNLFNLKMDTTSGLDRKSDYFNAISVWLSHPFMGAGINAGVSEGINIVNGESIAHYGFSSSFTKILGDNGLFLLGLIILSIFISIKNSLKNRDYNRMAFTIILMYLFMVIMFAQSYLMFYLFIFVAIWDPKKKLNYIEELE